MHGQPHGPVRRVASVRPRPMSPTPGTFRHFRGLVTCMYACCGLWAVIAVWLILQCACTSPAVGVAASPARRHAKVAIFRRRTGPGPQWSRRIRRVARILLASSGTDIGSLIGVAVAGPASTQLPHIVSISEFLSNRFQSIRRTQAVCGCCAVWIELNIIRTCMNRSIIFRKTKTSTSNLKRIWNSLVAKLLNINI